VNVIWVARPASPVPNFLDSMKRGAENQLSKENEEHEVRALDLIIFPLIANKPF
jgi:hypothetical protein